MTAVLTSAPTTTTIAARAVDAVKVYGKGPTEVRALDGISISFEAGRLTAIMGPSGSGKSTLLHCLAGLDTLTSGAVFIGDTDLTTLSDKELTVLRRERVGFVFQAFNLLPTLTAVENITLPVTLAGRHCPLSGRRTVTSVGPGGDVLDRHGLAAQDPIGEPARIRHFVDGVDALRAPVHIRVARLAEQVPGLVVYEVDVLLLDLRGVLQIGHSRDRIVRVEARFLCARNRRQEHERRARCRKRQAKNFSIFHFRFSISGLHCSRAR